MGFFGVCSGVERQHLQSNALFSHQLTGVLVHLAVVDAQSREDGECLHTHKAPGYSQTCHSHYRHKNKKKQNKDEEKGKRKRRIKR